MAVFEIYKDGKGGYRWCLRADNNEKIADSANGYTVKESCLYGIDIVKKLAPDAQIKDQT
jgi:uncharacterized protein YegP (UPF0339 family)